MQWLFSPCTAHISHDPPENIFCTVKIEYIKMQNKARISNIRQRYNRIFTALATVNVEYKIWNQVNASLTAKHHIPQTSKHVIHCITIHQWIEFQNVSFCIIFDSWVDNKSIYLALPDPCRGHHDFHTDGTFQLLPCRVHHDWNLPWKLLHEKTFNPSKTL